MSAILEAVRPIELDEIREARKRIADTIVRTPLIRLELGPDFPDIRLKLENLQPINAYKLRGAANAVAMLSESERRRGVWTISAGNAGQGVAYAARSEEHTSELQSQSNLVCRLLLEKKKKKKSQILT